MALRFDAAVRGDLKQFLRNDLKAGAASVTNVIRRATRKLKKDLRAQVVGAGLGRLGNAIRYRMYPGRGTSISAKGVVASSAIYKNRPGGLVDLITVFDEGATVNALGGKYLALQIGTGVQFGGRRAKAVYIDKKAMAIIPLRSGKGYLVVRRVPGRGRDTQGNYGEPILLLLKQVTIRKRLDIDSVARSATDGIDTAIVAEWEKQAKRLGVEG